MQERSQERIAFLMAVLLGLAVILVGRLFYWQVIRHGELVLLAQEAGQPSVSAGPSARGRILDQRGHILALDTFEYQVSAAPSLVQDVQRTTDRLSMALGYPREEIWQGLSQREAKYVLLKKNVPFPVGQALKSWQMPGITLSPTPKRVYPLGELVGHVTGFVGYDKERRTGYYGLESYYEERFRESSDRGSVRPGQDLYLGSHRWAASSGSSDLILRLDQRIQYLADKELRRGIQESQAESGLIIVMDPRDGGILAMVSYPSYDPNEYQTIAEARPQLFVNPIISSLYEPGSVFKIVTMAAALDKGLVNARSTYQDAGSITVGGRTIYNWSRLAYGTTTMQDLLAKSLNVGAATIALRMGQDTFYEYVTRFGFGEQSEVDLAGELPGLVKTPQSGLWHPSDLATNSFGQGIGVTPLQMISAMATVANGGFLLKPHVADKILEDGHMIQVPTVVRRRVISETTARQLTEMMAQIVDTTSKNSQVPGYRIAGKTGTAEIPDPKRGGYEEKATIASFAGFGPVDDPRLVILVRIDRPKTSPWGETVAGPVFSRLAKQLFALLDIPPDETRLALAEKGAP